MRGGYKVPLILGVKKIFFTGVKKIFFTPCGIVLVVLSIPHPKGAHFTPVPELTKELWVMGNSFSLTLLLQKL